MLPLIVISDGRKQRASGAFGPHCDILAPAYWLPSLDVSVKYIVGGLQRNSKRHHLLLYFRLQVQHSGRGSCSV